jgi:myo-inositol-1(or 4)-monophosphatase
VNFAYGIPHACVSIALQERVRGGRGDRPGEVGFRTVLGVVYDPFCEELWTAAGRGPARLNGRPVRVGTRTRLDEAVVSLGFGKHAAVLGHLLPAFTGLVGRVRKLRIMGSAALALTYVASGRFDAFAEQGLGWWDVAAGGFIVERAGGEFWRRALPDGQFDVVVANRRLRRALAGHLPATPDAGKQPT